MTSLSSFLRAEADNGYDSRIPNQVKAEIAVVMAAERAYERHIGKLESTFRTLKAAQDEARDRHAELQLLRRRFAGLDSDGAVSEMIARAIADAIDAAEWEEQCGVAYRQALRQAQSDAAQAGGETTSHSEGQAA